MKSFSVYLLLIVFLKLTIAIPFSIIPPPAVGVQKNSFNNIFRLRQRNNNNNNVEQQNPDELSGQFEGDIILTDLQSKAIIGLNGRNGRTETRYRWPNNIVYYKISAEFDESQTQYIIKALKNITDSVEGCIQFRQRTNELDYVEVIGSGSGCYSHVGRQGSKQQVNLETSVSAYTKAGAGCLRRGVIMHEFLHVLGFYHMHSASDRNNYITVNYNNVAGGKDNNFQMYGNNVVSNFGIPYDINSILHYGPTAFSKDNKLKTITSRINESNRMGQRDRMEPSDIARLKRMYLC